MVERTDLTEEEIRQDIAARRESITDAVDRLSDRFQQTFDWRAYVSNYPLAALGVVAGMGFLAARIIKPRPSAGKRIKDAMAYGIEDLASRFHNQLETGAPHRPGLGISRTVKAALMGLITQAATDYMHNRLVNRYTGHFENHESRHEWDTEDL
jgi:hypothetical protein